MEVKGFQATGLFPCDNNIFRPQDFPLASEDTDAATVNHPALVNISDQPSYCSGKFSPFTAAEALRAPDISAVPSLDLQLNPRGGTVKKLTSSFNKDKHCFFLPCICNFLNSVIILCAFWVNCG